MDEDSGVLSRSPRWERRRSGSPRRGHATPHRIPRQRPARAQEEATQWSYKLRYYVGALTTTYVRFNPDGTVYCEDTRVMGDQEGMDGWYEFYEVVW